MILTIFTVIVFISQLVILIAIIVGLLNFDRKLNNANAFLDEAKPKITDISKLCHAISEQMAELTPVWVDSFTKFKNKILLDRLESLISVFLFWGINRKMVRVFKKSKFLKTVFKGLSFLSHVV